jgi:hypothetical protein
MLLRCVCSSVLLLICAASSQAQISFRQGSFGAALPAFGGYSPGAGATMGPLPGGGYFFRQGSAQLALPQFGGYSPGVGITIGPFGGGGAGFNQGGAAAALPAFGGFNPGAGANVNFGGGVGGGGGNNGGGGNGGGNNAALRSDSASSSSKPPRKNPYTRKAELAEAGGRDGAARMYYRMAIKRASGSELSELQAKLDDLR